MTLALSADRLAVDRGGRRIIDGLSLRVEAGSALLLTGPNGAGKTTLIRTIAGFLRPVTGAVSLAGGDTDRDVGEQCHYVGHANALKASLTVRENLSFWASFLGGTAADVDTALATFRLDALAAIPAAYLSAGQKRRSGLARLLVARRPVWLLDEPTASLDAANSALLSAVVSTHCAAGGIAICATHLPLTLSRVQELKLSRHQPEATD
jgi:heme exporter protein A